MIRNQQLRTAVVLGALSAFIATAGAADITVQIENLAPANGTYLTPVWVGFHNGSFDIFDMGAPASADLERLAEDGNTGPLSAAFGLSGAGTTDATIIADSGIPPLAPGETATMNFTLDGSLAINRYFSYASMVIPSNDAFVGNADPLAHPIFAPDGTFLGADFTLLGAAVLDAGSEVNDELPANTAFFGQASPDTGVAEGGVIMPHPGFLPPGSGGILDDPMFSGADFTQSAYTLARITIVPEPATLALLTIAGLVAIRRR